MNDPTRQHDLQDAERIFHEALEQPTQDRRDFVRGECDGDSRLQREVMDLLDADADPTRAGADILDKPPTDLAEAVGLTSAAILASVPERIGPYRIIELLGSGGFADVFLAEQREPVRRKVALKILKPGIDSRAVLARFEAERQAMALMDHPGVAKIFDAGATERGRPYVVMEYVPGLPVTRYADERRLDIDQRLRLFLSICEAVQHAHQRGVIHRDLKPSNILAQFVAQPGEPSGSHLVRIIDFGIAKAITQPLTERTLVTEQGQLIGTPEYMSPEQASRSPGGVDTRTDVYALGVLLYELLTGSLPYSAEDLRSGTIDDLRRLHEAHDPPTPSTRLRRARTEARTLEEAARARGADPDMLKRRLRGDLDWIVMRALERDRERRYDSVSALAADIRRHLATEPVSVGPPSPAYRARKFVQRNRTLAVTTASVFLALLAGMIGTSVALVKAIASEQQEQWRLYIASIGAASDAIENAEPDAARRLLARAPQRHRQWEWRHLYAASDDSSWVFEIEVDFTRRSVASDGRVALMVEERATKLLPMPDGRLMIARLDGEARLLDGQTGREQRRLELPGYAASISPDGRYLASVTSSRLFIQDLRTGEEILHCPTLDHAANSWVWFDPNRPTLLTTGGSNGRIAWIDLERSDLEDADPMTRVQVSGDRTPPRIAMLGDGERIAVIDGYVPRPQLMDRDGANRQVPTGGDVTTPILDVLSDPDTNLIVTIHRGIAEDQVHVWDAVTGTHRTKIAGHAPQVKSIAVRGGMVAIGSEDRVIRLWRAATGAPIGEYFGHADSIIDLGFSYDGETLYSAATDNTVRAWRIADLGQRSIEGMPDLVDMAICDRPSATPAVVAVGRHGRIEAWDLESLARILEPYRLFDRGNIPAVCAWSGSWVVVSGNRGEVVLFDIETRERVTIRERFDRPVDRLRPDVDPGRGLLVCPSPNETVDVFIARAPAGSDAPEFEHAGSIGLDANCQAVAISPTDDALFVTDELGRLARWSLSRAPVAPDWIIEANSRPIRAVAVSPDGRFVATGDGLASGALTLWSAKDGSLVWRQARHYDGVYGLDFSPDGRRLTSSSYDSAVRLWDVETGEHLLAMRTDHASPVFAVAFSPDGVRLVSASFDGRIQIRTAIPAPQPAD